MTELPTTRPQPQPSSHKRLLPRRTEIVAIVQDHPYIAMTEIQRRFPMTPKRTIAYDVHQLVIKGYLLQHGDTRGVRYTAGENTIQ